MENRVLTIVFIDMQGYTKRSAEQTIDEMKRFHDEMHGFVNAHIEKWQGVMIKTLGDGFLVRFDSPTQAVGCGLQIQKKLDSRNAAMLDPDHIVRFRIGVNTGEVGIDEQGDLFGDPVNIASRIQSFAEPNEVFISESTYLAMNRNEYGTQDLGPQQFKNATREIRVYKVIKNGAAGLTLPIGSADDAAKTPAKSNPPWRPFLIGLVGSVAGILALFALFHDVLQKPESHTGTSSAANPPGGGAAEENGADEETSDVDPFNIDFSKIPLDKRPSFFQRGMYQIVKNQRASGNLPLAIETLELHVQRVQRSGKKMNPMISLMLGQLYYENGQKEAANQVFTELMTSMPAQSPNRQKFAQHIEKIQAGK